MGVLGVGLAFVGYLLVYAATANHGKFALSPWEGLTGDAYDGAGAVTPPVAPPTTPPGRRPPRGGGGSRSAPSPSPKLPTIEPPPGGRLA